MNITLRYLNFPTWQDFSPDLKGAAHPFTAEDYNLKFGDDYDLSYLTLSAPDGYIFWVRARPPNIRTLGLTLEQGHQTGKSTSLCHYLVVCLVV